MRIDSFPYSALAIIAMFFCWLVSAYGQQIDENCQGRFNQLRPSPEEIAAVLEQHQQWLDEADQSSRKADDERRANFCGADLSEVDVAGARLTEADLHGANLLGVNLVGADLSGADLSGADLTQANLSRAVAFKANLHGARLIGTELEWAVLIEADLRLATLDGAVLSGAALDMADLRGVAMNKGKLDKAQLGEAKLSGATLEQVDLNGAKLERAKLRDASLVEVTLANAVLTNASLQQASLARANLKGARLQNADLSGADLSGALLQDVELGGANVEGVVFEPVLESLPPLDALASTNHLEALTFHQFPRALVAVREEFRKAGMSEEERRLTRAIEAARTRQVWQDSWAGKIDATFRFFLFEITCQYGMASGLPLLLLIGLVFLFSLPYMRALSKSHPRAAIWVTAQCRYRNRIAEKHFQVRPSSPCNPKKNRRYWIRLVCIGLRFSLLSAFRVGWRDLDIGGWIARMQCRSYTLTATGWVRAIAGVQSLLSIYLLALWALTYFGRPFG